MKSEWTWWRWCLLVNDDMVVVVVVVADEAMTWMNTTLTFGDYVLLSQLFTDSTVNSILSCIYLAYGICSDLVLLFPADAPHWGVPGLHTISSRVWPVFSRIERSWQGDQACTCRSVCWNTPASCCGMSRFLLKYYCHPVAVAWFGIFF